MDIVCVFSFVCNGMYALQYYVGNEQLMHILQHILGNLCDQVLQSMVLLHM